MPKVLIMDYGVGNLYSLKTALRKTGVDVKISLSVHDAESADAIVLPGVGNFSAAATKLASIRETVLKVYKRGVPILGICLGLQLFFETSEEGPGQGLSLLPGKNVSLPPFVKVPHMGWNTLHLIRDSMLLEGVPDGAYVYFVHSLYPVPEDQSVVCAQTDYGVIFPSTIEVKNVFGTQFHPEKSGSIGALIIENFARIISR
jgi:glutamine amidotransferase